jgi:hypothetical protein
VHGAVCAITIAPRPKIPYPECRYGSVVVKIGDQELSTFGRGKFVGERTLVTGKLRSASCIAQTRVTAIVMQKREFLEVHNPMLDWMIPYDAASAVLKDQPEVKALGSDQVELLLDRFGPKVEAARDTVLVAISSAIDSLFVFISGTVELLDAAGDVRTCGHSTRAATKRSFSQAAPAPLPACC